MTVVNIVLTNYRHNNRFHKDRVYACVQIDFIMWQDQATFVENMTIN